MKPVLQALVLADRVYVGLALPMLPISGPGTYACEVLWQNELLGSYRIIADEMSMK